MKDRRYAAIAIGKSRKGNAHAILWGEIRKDENELYVEPHLTIVRKLQNPYLKDKKLSPFISSKPKHLKIKARKAHEIADIVMLIYGIACYKTGNIELATQAFIHAKTHPGYLMLGIIYLDQNEYELSLTAFENAIKINSKDSISYNNIAIVYLYLSDFKKSKRFFREGLRISPNNPDILSNSALLNLIEGKYDLAAKDYQKALDIKDNPIARSNLAF